MTSSILAATTMEPFWIEPPSEPYLVAETASYLVVYKPPLMHTAPLLKEEDHTLLAWAAALFPEVRRISGRKENEGGLLHRLDYETQGLVLIAKTEYALQTLMVQQENNEILKEYDAVSCGFIDTGKNLPGFPLYTEKMPLETNGTESNRIESAFRSFGKGGKAVRPLERDSAKSEGKPLYCTTIVSWSIMKNKTIEDKEVFRLRITKGFRHQIRCHLAWIGKPILNDILYGGAYSGGGSNDNGNNNGVLALRASSLAFTDPENGVWQTYSSGAK